MPDCLPIKMLRGWLAQELSSSEHATVATHVMGCTTCQAVLDAETDKVTMRSWLLAGPDCQIDAADLAITEQLLRERDRRNSRSGRVAEKLSGETAVFSGMAEPDADIGRIGSFRLLGELGRGGMGIVYRAWDERLRRVVAVKVLRPECAGPGDRLRLVREAQLASRFQNDHAVTIHAVVDPPDGLPYLVMEYVSGPTLAELIGSGRRPPPREVAVIVAQAAMAVDAAHEAGLIHRDVKPSNILIDATTGRAKITDFGVARALAAPGTITREGAVAGTPAYMSPEQARGDADLDPRSDVYSLGATLYEGVTGRPPFAGGLHIILRRIVEEDPIPLRRLNPDLPADLETICAKAMSKEPAARYQTARDLRDDVERWLRDEPIAARPATSLERGWRLCRRRPLVAGLALALLVALAAGVAGISWKWAEAVAERDRALRNFRQAREAVDTYLTQVSDSGALKAQSLEPLRRDLLRTARDFYERFVDQNPNDPELRAELGRAHGRLGLITSALESVPRALESYQKMGAIFEHLHEAYPLRPDYQQELAESYLRQGECLRAGAGTTADAVSAYERSRSLLEALVRAHPLEYAYQTDQPRTLRALANLHLFMTHDNATAESCLIAARQIYEHIPASYLARPAVRVDRARVVLNLAKLYSHTDRPGEHRAAALAAIALFEPLARSRDADPDHVMYLCDSLSELGESYRRLDQPELAETALAKAYDAADGLARSHPAHGYYRHVLADIAYSRASLDFHERRQPAAARAMLERAVAIEVELTIEFPAVFEYGFYFNNTVRDLRDWFGDTARLQAVVDQLNGLIRQHEAKFAPEQRDRAALDRLHEHVATVYALLERYGDAVAEDTKLGKRRLHYVALAQAQQREYVQAESTARELVGDRPREATFYFLAAQVAAYVASVSGDDRELTVARRAELVETQGRQAVLWLEQAQSLKYFTAPSTRYLLTDDRGLDPLRSRPDFQSLLARQEAANRPRQSPELDPKTGP